MGGSDRREALEHVARDTRPAAPDRGSSGCGRPSARVDRGEVRGRVGRADGTATRSIVIPTFALGRLAPEHLGGAAVGEQDVVRGGERVGLARAAGRVLARRRSRATAITHGSHCVIQLRTRSPRRRGDDLDVLGEGVDRLAHRPAAAVLERLRQVPVVERDEGLDAVRRAARPRSGRRSRGRRAFDLAAPVGEDARPRDREAEARSGRARASAARPRGSGGRSRRRCAPLSPFTDLPRRRAEAIPDALAPAVLGRSRPRSGTRTPRLPRRSWREDGALPWSRCTLHLTEPVKTDHKLTVRCQRER